jgi:cytochrome c peroxidase
MLPADQQAVTQVVVNFGKALGAYERLLSCGAGAFDRWVHGDAAALSRAAQRGAQLFLGKGQCLQCHSGPYLSDQGFHNAGLAPAVVAVVFIDKNDRGAAVGLAQALADPLNVRGSYSDGDDGRLPDPVPTSAEGAFRTPTLRCVSRRPSFMHTGQFKTLEEVIAFFDRGGHPGGYPGRNELSPLGLSDRERADLAAFLRALDGPGPDPSLLR